MIIIISFLKIEFSPRLVPHELTNLALHWNKLTFFSMKLNDG